MKLLFATGGTAGHINPALAVASYIKEQHPDYKIMFIGTADHMESRLVPNAGFEFKTIDINGFKRSFSPKAIIENVKTVGKLLRSEKESKNIIKEFQPDVVIGFGGYVSGPVLDEAAKLHIPTCIHEQNAYPGITNKQLAKKVDKVMLTVEDAANHMEAKCDVVITGLPVRGELLKKSKFEARIELGIADDKPLVLSFGGSLGAAPLNEAMFDIILENACVFAFYFGLAYFIGIIASDATDGMIKQTIEEKKACNKAVSNRALKIAVVVAIISTYMNIVTTNGVNNQIKDAQKEGIELVRENPTEYLDSDVFQQYIAEHIDDIKLDYDLFSYDDFE